MSAQTAIALVLALASTTLTNVAYLREHDAAAAFATVTVGAVLLARPDRAPVVDQ